MKTSTEILDELEKKKIVREELNRIREERKRIKAKEKKSPQKRSIEIVEHEDGTYSLVGFAWYLQLKEDEIVDAIKTWLNGSLEKGKEVEF